MTTLKVARSGASRSTFLLPILIAMVSGTGLLSALVANGIWDIVSWVALGTPVGLVAWFAIAHRRALPLTRRG